MNDMTLLVPPLRSRSLLVESALVAMLSVAFFALLVAAPHADPSGFDRAVMARVQGISWGELAFVPRLGSEVSGGLYGGYLIPASVGFWFAITRRWRLLALVLVAFALHYVLISPKLFVTAYRPSPLFGVEGAGGLESFPSGHVQWAASFYGLLAVVAWQSAAGRVRWLIVAGYIAVVLGAMLGRMELGRHWPVDVTAGLLVGLIGFRVLAFAHARWAARPARADEARSRPDSSRSRAP